MRNLIFYFAVFAAAFQAGGVGAQKLPFVHGRVLNEQNQPIQHVTVRVDASTQATYTNERGEFRLPGLMPGRYQIHFSSIGFESRSLDIELGESDLNLPVTILAEKNGLMEEVQVYGKYYQNYKMDSLSGSLRLQSSLLETPQNIQVLSPDLISDQMITDMRDGVLRNVSGVTMVEHWSSLFARVNMRGSRIAAFRNGMNVTGSWGPLTEDMSFVERIEFVKGPAGFMMSNGEPSGLYNVVTKKPSGLTKGEASVMVGSFSFFRAAVDLDGKLSKSGRLLYRLNLMAQSNQSHRDLEFNDRFSIAPVVSYQLDSKTKLTAEYTLQHATMSNVGSAYAFAKTGYAKLRRSFSMLERGIEPTRIKDHSAFLLLTHDFNSDWKLTTQLAYFNYNQQGSSMWLSPVTPGVFVTEGGDIRRYVGLWDALGQNKYAQVYVNGRFETKGVSHRLLGGLDAGLKEYFADWSQAHDLDVGDNLFNIYAQVYGKPGLSLPDFDRSADIRERGRGGYSSQAYTGLYLQDELGFWRNNVRLTVAGRYTHVLESSGVNIKAKRDKQRFTPRIGISGSLDGYTSVYALYDQSFIPQAGILRSGEQPIPITGDNYEVGVKRDWLGGKLNTTLAIYRILRNNTTAADPANAAGESFVINIGQTTVKGVEVDVKGQLAKGLDMVLNYAWTDGEITKASEAAVSTVGNKISGYARHNANAWLTYVFSQGVLKGVGVKTGVNYQGDRSTWTWTGATGLVALPDYFRWDGGFFWQSERVKVNLNINNILNQYLYSGSAYANYYYWQTEPGTNFRLGVACKF